MSIPQGVLNGAGGDERGIAEQLKNFATSKLSRWEIEARDEILQAATVRQWLEDAKDFRIVLGEAKELQSKSAFAKSVREYWNDLNDWLHWMEEALIDFAEFVDIGRPPPSDVHGNAGFVRERRSFQRDVFNNIQGLRGALASLKYPPSGA